MKQKGFLGKIICMSCIPALLLCGCQTKEQSDPESKQTVTLINSVKEADIWILPETEKNLKTTVWGTATASKVQTGERRQAPLCEAGDDGHYLFRMIDADSFYYAANGVTLEAGWLIEIKENDIHSAALEVTDENGNLKNTYEVFTARL